MLSEGKFRSSELIKLNKPKVANRQEHILLSAHNWWKENYLLMIVQILKRIVLLIRRQNKGYHQRVISLLLRLSLNTLANWRLPSHKWRNWSESTMCTHKTGEPINDLRLYIHLKARSLVAFRLDEQDFHLQQEADISIYSAIYQDATLFSSRQFWEAINTYMCISPTCMNLADLWGLGSSFWTTKPGCKASSWLEDHKDTHRFTSIKPMGLFIGSYIIWFCLFLQGIKLNLTMEVKKW